MSKYLDPKVSVDTVLLTLKDEKLHVGLARRDREPMKDRLALIGAVMDANRDENVEDVVVRSLKEKAGIEGIYFEQLYTFSGKSNKSGGQRDIRWPSVSVSHIALVPLTVLTGADQLARGLELVPFDEIPELPFDHNDIVDTALARLRGKGAWSVLPTHLLETEFTLREMCDVYEMILRPADTAGKPWELNYNGFKRKVLENEMLEPTESRYERRANRSVQFYRLRPGVSTIDARL